MRILLAAAEVAPFAKTGGLADVAGSLPRALRALGHEVWIMLPAYSSIDLGQYGFSWKGNSVTVRIQGEDITARLLEGRLEDVPVYLIDCPFYYHREGIYGVPGKGDFPDNAQRFGFFCYGVLEALRQLSFAPEVIHCNDWHTALIPVLLKTRYQRDSFYQPMRVLYTIHNLGYQGIFSRQELEALHLEESVYGFDGLEFYGKMNLMKGGIVFADLITTVSPAYAQEIQTAEGGFGLEEVLKGRSHRLFGILNGIDVVEWDPRHDPHIYYNYDISSCGEKKWLNKIELCKQLGLEDRASSPLIAVVSRLAEQKGIDLIAEVLPYLVERGATVVILGIGDAFWQETLLRAASRYQGRVSLNLLFSNSLAHRIYAAADLLLVPSRYEPCGLSQLIGFRYGVVPVARATGGLKDTVIDADLSAERGTGFVFSEYNPDAFRNACQRALDCYYVRPETWRQIVQRNMSLDYSWRNSALQYVALYYKATLG